MVQTKGRTVHGTALNQIDPIEALNRQYCESTIIETKTFYILYMISVKKIILNSPKYINILVVYCDCPHNNFCVSSFVIRELKRWKMERR